MPFEIIRRKEGEMSEKQEIRHSNVQVSINDWGHLVIREFDEPKGEEHLIVLDQETTSRLIQFIFSIRNTYEYKEFLKEIIRKSCDLPF